MTTTVPVALHWSGGKDSAHALERLVADDRYQVECLVTAVDGAREESSVHGLPTRLLESQAEAAGLPLHVVRLGGEGLDDYVEVMDREARGLRDAGIRAFAFGDLDHSGAAAYREEQFAPLGLEVVEPLSGLTSRECAEEFVRSGIVAVTVVVDAAVLGRRHLGRRLDRDFLDSLPEGCDPCGEAGEFHTVVGDAPSFREPVALEPGRTERVVRRIGTSDGVREFTYWRLHVR